MISVIVCTRNRARQLERCLLGMRALHFEANLAWQLIVVDNASHDSTRAVVESFASSLPIQYVFEARPGLSRARNRGVAEARFPILAFTDDDCIVSPTWLVAIAAEFERRPDLSVLSGRVDPGDAGDYPVATRMFEHAAQVTTLGEVLALAIGCNMALRRDALEQIGLFDPTFGAGTRVGSAEDIDLFYRALKAGAGIAYTPTVAVRHAHGRNTPASLASANSSYVRGRGAFYWKFIRDRAVMRMAYWEVRSLLKERPRAIPGSQSPNFLRSLAMGAVYRVLDGMVKAS